MTSYNLTDSEGNVIASIDAPNVLTARYTFAITIWPDRPAKVSRDNTDLTFADGEQFAIIAA